MNLHMKVAWEVKTQSIENNTTTIAWTLSGYREDGATGYITCGGFKVILNDVTVYEKPRDYRVDVRNGDVIASGTLVIAHNTDGTKSFDGYVEAGIYYSAITSSGTGSFTLDTIPRASSLTASNGTLATEQTLTINRASSTFKHRLTYHCGDVVDYIAGSTTAFTTATSIKWTPPIGLAAENTTGTSVKVKLTLYTYTSDGTHVGTVTKEITCTIPASVKPSVTIAWEDTTGAAATYGAPVQGLSSLKITLTAKTSQGSPIASYSITANGVTTPAAEATTEPLKTAGSNKINATVKDKRGRSGSASVTLDVLAYTAPVVSKLTVHRCNQDGTENDQGDYIAARFSAAVTALNNLNTATYKLRYKQSTATDYTEVTIPSTAYTVTDYEYIFEADGSSSYDVEVVATDRHGTATRATSASTAFTLMNWHPTGTGMAFGKVAERENAVEFGLPIYDQDGGQVVGISALVDLFLPVGSMVLRYDTKNPGTLYPGTTWTQIIARVLRAGAAGSIGAEGTLADGSGRTYIDVAVWRRTA